MLMTESQDDSRISEAQRLLQNATTADSRFAEAQYQLGMLRQNQGDWAASIAHLEKALSLKPDLSQAHYRLALAYWRTGRKQEAQAQMDMEKKYSSQQELDLDTRLRQITTFIVEDRQ
jgi:tetratricopeptide (TPR) repeat protein